MTIKLPVSVVRRTDESGDVLAAYIVDATVCVKARAAEVAAYRAMKDGTR